MPYEGDKKLIIVLRTMVVTITVENIPIFKCAS